MKNHFIIKYFGNKREEVETIYENINLDGITTIIEPFCGSSAFSYYLHTKHPKKFKYILNDNDDELIELYKICLDHKKLEDFQNKVNKIIFPNDDDKPLSKEQYNNITEPMLKFFIHHKYNSIRKGLYPLKQMTLFKKLDILEHPFVKFIRNEKVEICNIDGLELLKKYKDDSNCLLFIDPPYIDSTNTYYKKGLNDNIYEYCFYNDISEYNSKIYFCLENNWIIKMLFNKYKGIEYDKKYKTKPKKKTKHILIENIKKNI